MSFMAKPASLSFTDLEFYNKTFKNKALNILDTIENSISWAPINKTLSASYPIGRKKKGKAAYPPLMLFKCFLLKQWFNIKSDSELESLINDRISFKKFTGLTFLDKSPDSSTFSRFRKRISTKTISLLIQTISDQLQDNNIRLFKGSSVNLKIIQTKKQTP